jgi:hypothetical protein
MKRFVSAAALAACVLFGVSAPAGAIVVIGGAETTLGGPDTGVGVEVGFQPCIADGGIAPCIVDPTVAVRIELSSGRS